MEGNWKTFELSPREIRFKNILKKDYLELEMWAISDANPNVNRSHFTLDSLKKAVETNNFKNKPIVGFFEQGDFTTHEGSIKTDPDTQQEYWDTNGFRGEKILGWIRESDKVEIVEKNGLHWIKFTCVLCTQYCYAQVKRLLKDRHKKISVEIIVLSSFKDDNGIEHIEDFNLRGVTILGSKNGKPIKEGIEGAHLSIIDDESEYFQEQKERLSYAYKMFDNTISNDINNDFYGKEGQAILENEKDTQAVDMAMTIEVDKSKDSMSEKPWGEIDKTELRKQVSEASNFREVAPDIFLDLREGWEDGQVTSLKYPVMELKGNKAVYNRGALASAKAYAEKNEETEILSKIRKIYEDLDLNEEEEKDFCGDCPVDEENYGCGKMNSEDDSCEDDTCDDEDCSQKCEPTGDENIVQDENHDPDDCMKSQASEDDKIHELENTILEYKTKLAELQEQFDSTVKEYEAKLGVFADYEEIKARMEKAESTVWEHFCTEMKNNAASLMENEVIDKKDRELIIEKCGNGLYSSVDDLKKDIAIAIYNARPATEMRFSVNIPQTASKSESVNLKEMTATERISYRYDKKNNN